MSGIQSLLKYRFNKKEPDKISHNVNNGTQSSQGSTATDDSVVKPGTSASSSPWLSKHKAMNGNSFNSSQSSVSSQSTVPYSSQSSESLEERETLALIASLQDMFRNTDHSVIEDAIRSTNTFDEAVDAVINYNKDYAVKRKFKHIHNVSSSDSDCTPVKKKSRPLLDSQETIIIDDPKPPQTLSEKISFLQEAFPGVSRALLEETLNVHENDVALATNALDDVSEEEEEETNKVSLSTVSKGSIKDFKAARLWNKSKGHVHRDYEDDGENIKLAKGIGAAVKIKVVHQVADEDDYSEYDSDSEEESQSNGPIISFLNEASLDELTSMKGYSRKKAQIVVDVRPFDNWNDLVSKIEHSQELTFHLISSCKDVLRTRKIALSLMNSCKQISYDMESILSDISSKTTLDDSTKETSYVERQPDILNAEMHLKPYQLVGLNWLVLMHDQNLNGILGDEMGLGKTIQTIAFLAYLLESGDKGPHVIVAPSSTLDNWLRELRLWCPALEVMLYYGSKEERQEVRAMLADGTHEDFHVIMTTYNMASGCSEDRGLFRKLKFHYAIFDEGHMLKNMSSTRYQSLMKIKSARRLLLTGTPLQNNLVELMSLLAFVMPDLFAEKTDQIKHIFTSITSRAQYESKGRYEKEIILNAKNILKPFFLRRLKSDVLQQLPSKTDQIDKVSMAPEQQVLYDQLLVEFKTARQKDGNKALNGQAGSAMMMQLRKAANHQLLHRSHYTDDKLKQMAKIYARDPLNPDANVTYVYEDMEVMSDFELHQLCVKQRCLRKFTLDTDLIVDSGKFRYFDDLLPKLKEKGDRVLVFSQFVMVMDVMDYYMKARKHKFVRLDGSTPVMERQELIDKFNTDDTIFIFLLSTKAGGLGINLTAANAVILHDIDFNPYNDKQAEDRCHRVGQTKDVTVYRLISKNTIEEAMLRCAQAKLRLERDVTGLSKEEEEDSSNVASMLKEALAIEK